MNQKGGATPLSIRFYNDPGTPCNFGIHTSYNECGYPMASETGGFLPTSQIQKNAGVPSTVQQHGGATPLPMSWYNPEGPFASRCNLDGNPSDYISMLYSSPYAKKTAMKCLGNGPGTKYGCCGDSQPAQGQKGGGFLDGNCHSCPNISLDQNLDTLGNNADVITRDNLKRMYNTYVSMYGPANKDLFCNPDNWSQFRDANLTVGQMFDIIRSQGIGSGSGSSRRSGSQQTGGYASGAPFFIPNYGVNPNQTSGQMDDCSQKTTGFSYRFATAPSCTPFCSQWGNNLPTFNQV